MDTLTAFYLGGCFLTLLAAAYSNRSDVRMLLLTLLVAVGIYIPVPINNFYQWCMFGEFLVFCLSGIISARASLFIQIFSIQLIVVHFTGMHFWGYLDNSPYRIAVKVTEYSELLICLLLSNPFLTKFKEKIKCQNISPR